MSHTPVHLNVRSVSVWKEVVGRLGRLGAMMAVCAKTPEISAGLVEMLEASGGEPKAGRPNEALGLLERRCVRRFWST
jgi:hypothetical protein